MAISRKNNCKSFFGASIKSRMRAANLVSLPLGGAIVAVSIFSGFVAEQSAVDKLKKVEDINQLPKFSVIFEIGGEQYYAPSFETVCFKDEAFQEAFLEQLLVYSGLPVQQTLELRGVESLDEIVLFSGLNHLSIYDGNFRDISSLSNLSNLKSLSLNRCGNISDWSDLENCLSLEYLTISDASGIEDFSFVREMKNLKTLEISDYGAKNIDSSFFSKLSLERLTIDNVTFDDLSFLKNMTNLKDLSLERSNLSDLSFLADLTQLKTLYLSSCLISDVSSLYKLKDLMILNLQDNSVKDLDIRQFPNLVCISIKGNYNLYTDSLLDYCATNDIDIDITREDVNYVNKIRDIIKGMNLDGLSDIAKEEVIYDYIISSIEYDTSALEDEALLLSYNVDSLYYGLQGKGVCATYADMFSAFCQVAGVNIFTIDGYNHAWNLVEVDGQFVLCDPTWSDSLRNSFKYEVRKKLNLPNADYYFNEIGEDAERFVLEHVETEDGLISPRTKMVDGVISIDTSDGSGKEVTKRILSGVIAGSAVLVMAGVAAAKIQADKVRMQKAVKKGREEVARDVESSDYSYNNSFHY